MGMHESAVLAPLLPMLLVTAVVLDAGITNARLPHLERQTPRWYPRWFGSSAASLLWGIDLGLGWTTRSCFATYFGAIALVFWAGDPLIGAAAVGAYGFGRGISVIAAGIASARVPFDRILRAPGGFYQTARIANTAALASVAGLTMFLIV